MALCVVIYCDNVFFLLRYDMYLREWLQIMDRCIGTWIVT